MQSYRKGDLVSVLAVVAYDFTVHDLEFGVPVRVIGPKFESDNVRAKLENVSLKRPVIEIGEIVSNGLADWKVLAICGEFLWLQRDGGTSLATMEIADVHRKDKTEPELPLGQVETPPTPPAAGTLDGDRATDAELAKILGYQLDELPSVFETLENGTIVITTLDGEWVKRSARHETWEFSSTTQF